MTYRFGAFILQALVIAGWPQASQAEAQSPSATHQNFVWVDMTNCRKPKVRPPRVPPEDYEEYNFQRRYLALVPGDACFIMDSYIERLGGSSSPGMRTLGARGYRLERGRWVRAGLAFGYFPYAIRRQQDGRIFYVEALLAEDLMDGMVGSHWDPVVSTAKSVAVTQTPESDMASIDWIRPSPGEVLQGLAVLLSQGLRSTSKNPAAQEERERKRIRQLLKSAWETVPVADRVAVDADGLPR